MRLSQDMFWYNSSTSRAWESKPVKSAFVNPAHTDGPKCRGWFCLWLALALVSAGWWVVVRSVGRSAGRSGVIAVARVSILPLSFRKYSYLFHIKQRAWLVVFWWLCDCAIGYSSWFFELVGWLICQLFGGLIWLVWFDWFGACTW